jgi:hypothetical protein
MNYVRTIVTAAVIGVLAAVSMSSQPSIAKKVDVGMGGGSGELPMRLTPLW